MRVVGGLLALLLLWLMPTAVEAATASAVVVAACGTPPVTYTAGQTFPLTQDTTGTLCAQGGGGGGSGLTVGTTTITSGTTTRMLYDNAGVLGEAAGVTTNGTNLSVVSGSFGLSGNISVPAWTTNGVRYKNVAATMTDTTSSGTVAAAYTDLFGGNTIAASSATTFTNYYGAFVNSPAAGTNVTLTNVWALGASSARINGVLNLNGNANLFGDAVNTLAQRNGANAQRFNLYNTYTDASNYERGVLDWITNANVLTIGAQAAGTGTLRQVTFVGPGPFNFVSSAPSIIIGSTTTSNRVFQFKSSVGADGNGGSTTGYIGVIGSNYGIFDSSATTILGFSTANLVQFMGTTSSFPALKRSTTTLQVRLADDSGQADLSARMLQPQGFTVATLPVAPPTGSIAYATDAVACTFLATLTGGGSAYCPVTYNGSAWVGG